MDASPPPQIAPKKMRNKFEQFIYDRFGDAPNHRQHLYLTDEDLNKRYRAMGCKEDELAERRRQHDESMDKLVGPNGLLIQVKGFKPGDTRMGIGHEDTYIAKIAGRDNLVVRFYPGGLESKDMYMFDFFDLSTERAVNSRAAGFEIDVVAAPDFWSMSMIGTVSLSLGRLNSWEVNCGLKDEDIKPGAERFSLPEGTIFKLVCGGEDHGFFKVPVSQRTQQWFQQFHQAVPFVA